MTIYLLNSLPNSLIARDHDTLIKPVSAKSVAYACSQPDLYEDFDDNTPPSLFSAVSGVGHASTATLFSKILEQPLQAFHAEKPIIGHFVVPVSRIQVVPVAGDTVYCGLFTPPRRLQENEQWSEADILQMDINWVRINY